MMSGFKMEDITGYYQHDKNKATYAAIGSCRIKNGDDWSDGVVYMQHQNIFVRDREDFLKTFNRVSDE